MKTKTLCRQVELNLRIHVQMQPRHTTPCWFLSIFKMKPSLHLVAKAFLKYFLNGTQMKISSADRRFLLFFFFFEENI